MWKLGGGVGSVVALLFGGGAGCGERVRFCRFFGLFFIKTFHLGGLNVCGFGW